MYDHSLNRLIRPPEARPQQHRPRPPERTACSATKRYSGTGRLQDGRELGVQAPPRLALSTKRVQWPCREEPWSETLSIRKRRVSA